MDRLSEGLTDGLSKRETVLVTFAEMLTRKPQALRLSDISALRDQNLTDEEIHDLVQVTAYFAYVNRIVLGLGAELGAGEGPPGAWPE